MAMIGTPKYHAGFAGYENIGEAAPIFVIPVNDESHLGIYCDVAQAFELRRHSALRFLIDGRVKIVAVEDETDRNHMRLAGFVRRGEMRRACGANEP